MAEDIRGDWQKAFVQRLLNRGFSHEAAIVAMGETEEERQITYMQGYNNR